jgi:hypothetical protein
VGYRENREGKENPSQDQIRTESADVSFRVSKELNERPEAVRDDLDIHSLLLQLADFLKSAPVNLEGVRDEQHRLRTGLDITLRR